MLHITIQPGRDPRYFDYSIDSAGPLNICQIQTVDTRVWHNIVPPNFTFFYLVMTVDIVTTYSVDHALRLRRVETLGHANTSMPLG